MASSARVRYRPEALSPDEALAQRRRGNKYSGCCFPLSRGPVVRAGLKKFLKKSAEGEDLAVLDTKLGQIVKEKLGIPCVHR